MGLNKFDASTLYDILEAGFLNLSIQHKLINDLNVFPVPDGDTGTNMRITYKYGMDAIQSKDDVSKMLKELAGGMLLGARGNSGVLLSQYYRGISEALVDKNTIRVSDLVDALEKGYQRSYASCEDPREGTILTVAREGIEKIKSLVDDKTDFDLLFSMVANSMRESLDNTPNLLPVLKEAGVIDSGGKGLLTIFEGYLKYIKGENIETSLLSEDIDSTTSSTPKANLDYSLFNEKSNLDYGYCTEFLLQLLSSKINIKKFNIDDFIAYLKERGNSIVCFQSGTIVKVHIHTKKPYQVIEYAQQFGEFITFKMENMALQHNNVIAKENERKKERKKVGIVTIAQGEGIIELFKELGADVVLNGGTTMNTSTAEMIDAFKQANADTIILLPNESNILLAAKQAKELYKDSEIRLIETKNIPQGYSALSMLMISDNPDEVYSSLIDGVNSVLSGFVAQSSRESTIQGKISNKGSYIEGIDDKLISFKDNRKDAVLDLLSHISDIKDKQVLFLIKSKDVPDSEAEETVNEINKLYPHMEVGLIDGKQEVYDYLIGVDK